MNSVRKFPFKGTGKEDKGDISFSGAGKSQGDRGLLLVPFFTGLGTGDKAVTQNFLSQATEETAFGLTSLVTFSSVTSSKIYSTATHVTHFFLPHHLDWKSSVTHFGITSLKF